MNKNSRIYLDYAASTPVDPLVFDAMKPYFCEKFGNPGSLHSFGQEAIAAVDASRETIAKAIGAEFGEIIFTGSATEANNLVFRGVMQNIKREAPNMKKSRVIVSAIEHESVFETARALEKEGVEVVYVPVHKNGIVDLGTFESLLNDRTVLVSVMYANNEIGTIQPIAEIAKIIDDFKKEHYDAIAPHRFPLLHTDAAQAFQFLDCDVKKLGVDMMTLSAHKIYGPKGIGCLYMRQPHVVDRQSLTPIIFGGGQEFGMRSGTENVPSIVGFAKAVDVRSHLFIRSNEQMNKLRDYLWRGIRDISPRAERNGWPSRGNRPATLPNILNVYFPGREAQDILTRLDLQGIAVSSGSACRARALEPSYVIKALGYSKERTGASIRMSLGRPTTKKEVDITLAALKSILN